MSPTAVITYDLPLPLDLPAAERLTCGLDAYFLDEPQLQPPAEPGPARQAGTEAEQGPMPGPMACCRAEAGSTPHPLASGDPMYHGMSADSSTPLDGMSPGSCGCDTQHDAALPGEHRVDPGQPGVVVGDSNACGGNKRWTAHAALVLNAPAAAACTGTLSVQGPGSAPALSAAAGAAQHVPDGGPQEPRPVLTGMQETPGASGEPEPCAAGSVSIYTFESWAPLQRPAGALAKALCDGALWGAFGIGITARPCLCLCCIWKLPI